MKVRQHWTLLPNWAFPATLDVASRRTGRDAPVGRWNAEFELELLKYAAQ